MPKNRQLEGIKGKGCAGNSTDSSGEASSALKDIMGQIASLLVEIEGQDAVISAHRDALLAVAGQKEDLSSQLMEGMRRLEERDRQLVEKMRHMLEEHKREWYRAQRNRWRRRLTAK